MGACVHMRVCALNYDIKYFLLGQEKHKLEAPGVNPPGKVSRTGLELCFITTRCLALRSSHAKGMSRLLRQAVGLVLHDRKPEPEIIG